MTETQAVQLFKCLADKSRLEILNCLTREEMYVERLAQRLSLTPATISFHLKKLEELGAVTWRREQYYTMYALCPDIFRSSILDIIRGCAEEEKEQEQDLREAAYRKKVLTAFMEYGKLKSIPAQRKKENIILEEIAAAFSPDRTYTEKEVNLIIADFYDDFCTLRRDMISAGLMTRENSIYRKISDRAN